MNRRDLLRGVAVAGGIGIAGCLERLGFEEQSAWANPPIVDDRPDAVYLPAGIEEMGHYGITTDGDYALFAGYTIPHRFWIPGEGGSMVDVDTDDSLHLMLSVWDRETELVLPVDMHLEILDDGTPIDGVGSSPWPMISQRMGFHYGDNVPLPGDGSYTLEASVGPVDLQRTGVLENRLEERVTLSIEFEYAESDVHDIDVELFDEDRRGEREAVPLMDHAGDDAHDHGGDHDDEHSDHGDDGHNEMTHPPTSRGPPIDDLPGNLLGTERTGDAAVSALLVDDDRFEADGSYLAICPRTPYNDVILPFTSLSVAIDRADGDTEETSLTEALDETIGHHYGTAVEEVESGDELTLSIDTPPQVSRHDGYETAFFEFEDVTYTV